MATMEKLVKALEALKIQQLTPVLTDDSSVRKKEKITNCLTIADALCYSGVRSSSNFLHLLSVSMEILLQLCDDPHSDVRMIADESLNRIIRALSDSNVVKIQVELHKEIKKNGSARTLRAALWRFAELCHLIRPQKCKPYVQNLMPCIVHIARRTEESVLETLAAAMPKIFKALGNFTTDNDVKGLLKAFLTNLSSNSAVVRRTATSSILTICLSCRKPHVFISYILNTLLDSVVPLRENQPVSNVLGVLACLRNVLPHVTSVETSEEMRGSFGVRRSHQASPLAVDRMIQVYELCLHFTNHPDHNVVNAALETLCQLLASPPGDLLPVLTSTAGITRCRIHPGEAQEKLTRRTLSQMSVAMSLVPGDEESLMDADSEDVLPDVDLPSVTAWVQTLNVSPQDEDLGPMSVADEQPQYSNIQIGRIDDKEADLLSSLPPLHMDRPEPLPVHTSEPTDEVKEETNSPSPTSTTPAEAPFKAVNVGSVNDGDVALFYCMRHLASRFLLCGAAGRRTPDKHVRVSVKALALNCCANALRLYPTLFHMALDKDADVARDDGTQLLSDVLLYATHPDPQLRGITASLVASLIQSGLQQPERSLTDWLADGPITLHDLVQLLLTCLSDESSVCCRQAMSALGACLPTLLESVDSRAALPLLDALPRVACNSYWLVKVRLAEVVAELPYATIQHVTGDDKFQSQVVENVVMALLGDEDARVRHATAIAITRLVPLLFYSCDHPRLDTVTVKATLYTPHYLSPLLTPPDPALDSPALAQRSHAPVFPFDARRSRLHGAHTEAALSRMVDRLAREMLSAPSKHLTHGCCEALCHLTMRFVTTVFPLAWNCQPPTLNNTTAKRTSSQGVEPGSNLTSSLVALSMSLLTSSPMSLDLGCQLWLIRLSSNLISGLAVCYMRPLDIIIPPAADVNKHMWNIFRDKQLSALTEQLMVHTVRMLNIFVHVMEETKPTLPGAVLSPMKRREKQGAGEREEERKISRGSSQLGFFVGTQHYARIHELVRSAYSNYKSTLDSGASEKFVCLLSAVLESLSQLLEVATLQEAGRIAEELLAYLRVTMVIDPTTTVQCVQQLLKCLFGTNLSGQWEEVEEKAPPPAPPVMGQGFYSECFQTPYRRLQEYINTPTEARDKDEGSMWMNYLRRKGERKQTMGPKGLNRGADKASLASYIRLFEPMVIKSLKQYTVTSDVKLQCRVLMLLSQLVQLRVNYCLLDSDQIFIGFVLKQFEYIEEGQIPEPQNLIPKIFFFLVHLSYEKHHSKVIIGVPKVIQLCDGLMASGQSPTTHCIPALVPVVEDVFLVRGVGSSGADLKELETQREVLVAMMLRLVEYHQVLDLLSTVLSEAQAQVDGEERWRRWSQQVLSTLLPLLSQGRVRLETAEAQQALQRLLGSAAPSALRPSDQMLRVLFSNSPHSESLLVETARWLGMVLGLLIHLLATCKEDSMLTRVAEMELSLPALGSARDPLNVGQPMLAEMLVARFLLRVVGLVASQLYAAVFATVVTDDWRHLHDQFSHFLLVAIHMFESGGYRRVALSAMQLVQGHGQADLPTSDLNALFSELAVKCPLITFQWCYLLTLLGYNDRAFWARILRTQPSILHETACRDAGPSPCVNLEVARRGGAVAYCDLVCDQLTDADLLSWLLVNHMQELVALSDEPPVQELIGAVHRNPAASGLLVQAVASTCTNLNKPGQVRLLLRCLWPVHPSQSGALLRLLVPRMVALRQVALARQASALACRRAELLLTLAPDDVEKQLSKEELLDMLEAVHVQGFAKKHVGLVNLLNKIASHFHNLPPYEIEPKKKNADPDAIRAVTIDKSWFLSQVKLRCSQRDASGAESAQLLSHLPYDDIVALLASRSMNVATLQDCIQLGAQLTLQAYQRLPSRTATYDAANFITDAELAALEAPLYKAARLSLLNHVQSIRSLLPRPHQVFNPLGRLPTSKESKFSQRLDQLLTDEVFWSSVLELAPAVSGYMAALTTLVHPMMARGAPPQESWQSLAKFGVLCLEAVAWLTLTQRVAEPRCLEAGLRCADLVLRDQHLAGVVGQASNVSYLGSASTALTRVVTALIQEPLPALTTTGLTAALEDVDTVSAAHSCHQMSTLVTWLERRRLLLPDVPPYLAQPVTRLIVSLARMPLVNTYVATPPEAWRQGWRCQLTGPAKTTVPPLSVEFLQDVEVLQQFIFRVTLLGWTSRQQFEETWMSLLSLLDPALVEGDDVSSLAIEAITALLVQTLLLPVPGDPNTGRLIHQPRAAKPRHDNSKLRAVHERLGWLLGASGLRLESVFTRGNAERFISAGRYGRSQLSMEFLWTATRSAQEGAAVSGWCLSREQCLGLDLHSCLHFLLELYSQWLHPGAGTSLRLLSQAVSSTLAISDLFTEKSQFQWLLNTCLELGKSHPAEDELLHQSLVLGACKAAAVLSPDADAMERVRRMLEAALRSAFLPARIAGLHSLLHLLQNTAADESSLVSALGIEYVAKHASSWSSSTEEHNLLVWSLAFHLIETLDPAQVDTELGAAAIQPALTLALAGNMPYSLHLALINGLERLVLTKAVSGKVAEQVTKVAVECVRHPSCNVCVPGLQLLLTCMYTGEEIGVAKDPERLIEAMEKTSALFDRIKRGYPCEVELLCGVLPHLLTDFFPPSEVLTKVIGEFLSPHQPHPRQLAAVVFQVFEQACQQSQLPLLQDWVVISLANFTQCSPIGMAAWCITCFFLSASTNTWLRALFPHVQSRIGRLEADDKRLLRLAARDFYHQLTDDKQKQTFVATFENAAQSPFSDLVTFL